MANSTGSPTKKKVRSSRLSGEDVSHSNSSPSITVNNSSSIKRQGNVPSAMATAVPVSVSNFNAVQLTNANINKICIYKQVESSDYHTLHDVVVFEDFEHSSISG